VVTIDLPQAKAKAIVPSRNLDPKTKL
jgi:hypothetical protein